jgi:NAD(P)-dependent dehydrogenase (short-subunit alcohol dehydrogenase family)
MKKNSQKYAIVTGAASGIGLDIANYLSMNGVYVFGLDINPITYPLFKCFICDVSKERAVIKTLSKIKLITNAIDYLINVAGVLTVNKKCYIKDLELKDWNKMLSNNLTSVYLMTKYTYPLLKNSNSASIVNISSDQAFEGKIGFIPYGVTKAGINMLTQITALELIQDGIRVNAIAPGAVQTNILSSLFNKEQIDEIYKDEESKSNILQPCDITDIISFLLSENSKNITGEIIKINKHSGNKEHR